MGLIHSNIALTSMALLAAVICTACCSRVARADDLPSPSRHLYVVNATPETIAVLGFSLDKGVSFQTMDFPEPLRGRGSSMMVNVPAGGCLQDIRVQFLNHKELMYRNFDVCRRDGLRVAKVP